MRNRSTRAISNGRARLGSVTLLPSRRASRATARHVPRPPIGVIIYLLPSLFLLPGCISSKPSNPAATQPATAVDPILAEPSHWLSQPPTDGALAFANGRDTLWNAAEEVARRNYFRIDRRDHRAGLLTTVPLVSKQWFELWRNDAIGAQDVQESSLGPIRRTLYFEFSTTATGRHSVTPKVLVERQARLEEKYRSGDAELPNTYWYALRRDAELELRLSRQIQSSIKDAPPPAPSAAAQ